MGGILRGGARSTGGGNGPRSDAPQSEASPVSWGLDGGEVSSHAGSAAQPQLGTRARLTAARWRVAKVTLLVVVLAAAVGTPLLLPSLHPPRHASLADRRSHLSRDDHQKGPAGAVVSAALAKTHEAALDVSYSLSETPSGAAPTVSGSGEIGPQLVNVSADISNGQGSSGLSVRVIVGPNGVAEIGGADYGLPQGADQSATAATLEGFFQLVEQELGMREGPVAMLAMASPEGFLGVASQEVSAARETGSSTVDGIPVTDYAVTMDQSQLLSVPGITPDEVLTVKMAEQLLVSQGMSADTVDLAIDSSGFVRQAKATTTFSDGGRVTLEGTLSPIAGCPPSAQSPSAQTGSSQVPAESQTPPTAQGATTTTLPTESTALTPTAGTLPPTTVPVSVPPTTVPPSIVPTTTAPPTTVPPSIVSPTTATTGAPSGCP